MTAIERAEQDVARGEYWLARRRLESYLVTRGYDPAVLARLGEISYEMKDTYAAGRAWLLSSATGEHVESAVETFVKHAGAEPRQITSSLYRSAWPENLSECDPLVQSRVERFGLKEAITRGPKSKGCKEGTTSWGERFMILACIAFVLFCLASCAVGATQIFSWMFGG